MPAFTHPVCFARPARALLKKRLCLFVYHTQKKKKHMRMSRRRTGFSKARSRRKTSFPLVAVVQKKHKPHYTSGDSLKRFSDKESLQTSAQATNSVKRTRAAIDYKNVVLLRKLITAEGKILPRRINKLTAKQQRYTSKAIKSARIMGLLPFINKSASFSV